MQQLSQLLNRVWGGEPARGRRTGGGNRADRFRRAYARSLAERCGSLVLPASRGPQTLNLLGGFVCPWLLEVQADSERPFGSPPTPGGAFPLESAFAALAEDGVLPRMAILGETGAGKTTLLRYLTLACSAEGHSPYAAPGWQPLLLSVTAVAARLTADPGLDLPALAREQIGALDPALAPLAPRDWLHRQLDRARVLVLLDGFDAIADRDRQQQTSAWIAAQMRHYPDTAFVLVARPADYRRAPLPVAVQLWELEPFDRRAIKQAADQWLLPAQPQTSRPETQHSAPRPEAQRRQRASEAIVRLEDDPSWSVLGKNPLVLTLLLALHDRGRPWPDRPDDLYDALFAEAGLDADATAARLLGSLALENLQRDRTDWTDADLAAIAEDPDAAAAALALAVQTGLAVPALPAGRYSFFHDTLGSYLAARELWRRGTAEPLVAAAREADRLGRWATAIRFYAARGDASAVVQAALERPTLEGLETLWDCLNVGAVLDAETQAAADALLDRYLESSDPALADLAARARLQGRLQRLAADSNPVAIDGTPIACAEYQLFIDEQRARGQNHQPTHWKGYRFPTGTADRPIAGVRPDDADAFCGWLNRRFGARDRTYRLPTAGEAGSLLALDAPLGYWVWETDPDDPDAPPSARLEGLAPEQWDAWQQQFDRWQSRDLARALAIDRALALDPDSAASLTRDPSLALDLSCDPADLDLNRDRDRALDFDLALNLAMDVDLAMDLSLVLALARALNRDLARTLKLALELTLDLARSRDLERANELALNLAVNLSNDLASDLDLDLDLDLRPVRSYLLVVALFWQRFAQVYDRAARSRGLLDFRKLTRTKCLELSDLYAAKCDRVYQFYRFVTILDERRLGHLPAWEGIRLVCDGGAGSPRAGGS